MALSGAVLIDRKNRKSAFGALEQAGRDMKRRGVSYFSSSGTTNPGLPWRVVSDERLIIRSHYGSFRRELALNLPNHHCYHSRRALSIWPFRRKFRL